MCTLPHGWIISDSNSYVNQAIAIANGSYSFDMVDQIDSSIHSLLGTRYALGNAHWLALIILLFGKKYVFLSGLITSVGSLVFVYKALQKLEYPSWTVLLIPCFLPFLLFSKSLMSGMPSLLVTSLFLYLLVSLKGGGRKWLFLCVLASFSFWFRESNIILLGGICLFYFMMERKYFIYYALGATIGMLPRLISAYFAYDDPFYYVLAEPFTLESFTSQVWIYGVLTMLLIPGGLFFMLKYRGDYYREILVSVVLFLLFYTAYSYTSVPYSGFYRGIILTGRFVLPVLPFFVLFLAYFFRNSKVTKFVPYFYIIFIIATVVAHIGIDRLSHREEKAAKWVDSIRGDHFMFYDNSGLTNILRYINPLTQNLTSSSDIANIADTSYMNIFFTKYKVGKIFLTKNIANNEKSDRTAKIKNYINAATDLYKITPIDSLEIESNLAIIAYEIEIQ